MNPMASTPGEIVPVIKRSGTESPMVSVICVFDDPRIYREYLLKSLTSQQFPHEIVSMDNTTGNIASAAAAYVVGAKSAHGDLLVYCHQDVVLYRANALEALWRAYLDLTQFHGPKVALGLIGSQVNRRHSMFEQVETLASDQFLENFRRVDCRTVTRPTQVDSFDECIFAVPRSATVAFPIDSVVSSPWHFYVTTYTYELAHHGYKNFLVQAAVSHVPMARFSSTHVPMRSSVDSTAYAQSTLSRIRSFYRESVSVEQWVELHRRSHRQSPRLSTTVSRFPLPTRRFALYRFGVGVAFKVWDSTGRKRLLYRIPIRRMRVALEKAVPFSNEDKLPLSYPTASPDGMSNARPFETP